MKNRQMWKPGQVLTLTMSSMVGGLVFTVPPIFFPATAAELGTTNAAVGITASIVLFVAMVTSLVAGPKADRFGIRLVMLVGALSAAGFFLGFSTVQHRFALVPVAVLGGIAFAILPNLAPAAAGSISNEETRRRAIGWTSAGTAISIVVGIPLITSITYYAGWRIGFGAAAIFALGVSGMLYRNTSDATRVPADVSALSNILLVMRTLESRKLLTSSALRALAWFGMLTYLGAFLNDQYGLATSGISLVYVLGGLAFTCGTLVAKHFLARFSPNLLIGVLNLAVGMLIFLLYAGPSHLAMVVVIVPIMSLIGGVTWVGILTALPERSPVSRASTLSINGVLYYGASAFASAVGGILLSIADYRTLGIVLLVPAIASSILIIRVDWSVFWAFRPFRRAMQSQ